MNFSCCGPTNPFLWSQHMARGAVVLGGFLCGLQNAQQLVVPCVQPSGASLLLLSCSCQVSITSVVLNGTIWPILIQVVTGKLTGRPAMGCWPSLLTTGSCPMISTALFRICGDAAPVGMHAFLSLGYSCCRHNPVMLFSSL